MINLAYSIRRGFFSHIINVASTAAPPNAVSVCICSLYPLPNICLILSCRIGGSVSIVCADSSRPLSCWDERESEDDLIHLWSMLVVTARPILPPKIRACVNAPTKTATAKVNANRTTRIVIVRVSIPVSFSSITVGAATIIKPVVSPIPKPSITWYPYCAGGTPLFETDSVPIRATPIVCRLAPTKKR